jgi:hypothetical protein
MDSHNLKFKVGPDKGTKINNFVEIMALNLTLILAAKKGATKSKYLVICLW